MAGKRPFIDTEPDEVFEAVFGAAAEEPFGPAADRPVFGASPEAPGPDPAQPEAAAPDVDSLDIDGPDTIDLDALELSDEIDEAVWAEADPEADGVSGEASGDVSGDVLGDAAGDAEVIDLDAALPDEIDEAVWAAMEAEEVEQAGTGEEAGSAAAIFDAQAAEALRSRWMAHLDSGVIGFRLDIRDKAAIDAAGLAFLAAFARELKSAGGALTVAASGQVLEVLSLCGLDRRWPVALEGESS